MLSTLKAAAFAATIAGFSLAAYAAPLATWSFETTPPSGTGQANGPYLADSGLLAGTSNANGFHASEATTWSNPSGNGSLESWSSNNWAIGDYYQFATSTTGFEDIIVTFDQTRSSTGPADFELQYSLDGNSFTGAGAYTVGALTWSTSTPVPESTFTFDLTGISALENASSVTFRLVATGAASGTAGTNRVDNFNIEATAIPEPTSLAVIGLGGLLALRRRRA